jgi:hypothetical protein
MLMQQAEVRSSAGITIDRIHANVASSASAFESN